VSAGHPDLSRWDASAGAEREALLSHLRECGACRSAWIAREPSRVFALLAAAPVPAAVLDGVSRSVRQAIGHPASYPRAVPRLALPGGAACAAALLLSLAAGWLLSMPGGGRPVLAEAPALSQPRGPHADVELLSSPGDARLVDLTVGDTQVVMIFDEGLEL
jgi:hypothetical protein